MAPTQLDKILSFYEEHRSNGRSITRRELGTFVTGPDLRIALSKKN